LGPSSQISGRCTHLGSEPFTRERLKDEQLPRQAAARASSRIVCLVRLRLPNFGRHLTDKLTD